MPPESKFPGKKVSGTAFLSNIGNKVQNKPIGTNVAQGLSAAAKNFDWAAYDYAPGVLRSVAEECLAKIGSFQDLFSLQNIGNIPADKYDDIVSLLTYLSQLPNNESTQEEYMGRLGQLAEIVGNQDIIDCIDAVRSYNYDQQMAASNSAAATSDSGSRNPAGPNVDDPTLNNDPVSTNQVIPSVVLESNAPVLPKEPPLWLKLIRPWYSKVILLGLVGGLGYYGYTKFKKKNNPANEEDLELEELEEDRDNSGLSDEMALVRAVIRANPKKKRKKKVRISRKKQR
jgi:hypothetical protein